MAAYISNYLSEQLGGYEGFLWKLTVSGKQELNVLCVFQRQHAASSLKHRLTLNILELFAGKFRLVQLGGHCNPHLIFQLFLCKGNHCGKIQKTFPSPRSSPEGQKARENLSSCALSIFQESQLHSIIYGPCTFIYLWSDSGSLLVVSDACKRIRRLP